MFCRQLQACNPPNDHPPPLKYREGHLWCACGYESVLEFLSVVSSDSLQQLTIMGDRLITGTQGISMNEIAGKNFTFGNAGAVFNQAPEACTLK
jgi:hypothetical protein